MSISDFVKKAVTDAILHEVKTKVISNVSFDSIEKFAKDKINQVVEQVSDLTEKVTEKVTNEKTTEFKFDLNKEYFIKNGYIWIDSLLIPEEIKEFTINNINLAGVNKKFVPNIVDLPSDWFILSIGDEVMYVTSIADDTFYIPVAKL